MRGAGYMIPGDRKGKFVSALWHFLLLWKRGAQCVG